MSMFPRNEPSLTSHFMDPSMEQFMAWSMGGSKSRSLRFPWVIGGS